MSLILLQKAIVKAIYSKLVIKANKIWVYNTDDYYVKVSVSPMSFLVQTGDNAEVDNSGDSTDTDEYCLRKGSHNGYNV